MASIEGPTVLVAEDDGEMRSLLVLRLRRRGLQVVEAASGADLMLLLKNRRLHGGPNISLVITDVRMPGLSGLDVVRWLRQHDARVAVILMTAFASAAIYDEARALSARVFDKPFDVDDLCAAAMQLVPSRAELHA